MDTHLRNLERQDTLGFGPDHDRLVRYLERIGATERLCELGYHELGEVQWKDYEEGCWCSACNEFIRLHIPTGNRNIFFGVTERHLDPILFRKEFNRIFGRGAFESMRWFQSHLEIESHITRVISST